MAIEQLGWTGERRGIRWSSDPFYRRFSIVRTATGFTVSDHLQKDMARLTTFAAAKAWAGIRIGERCVRH